MNFRFPPTTSAAANAYQSTAPQLQLTPLPKRLPSTTPSTALNLIQNLLKWDPKTRPTASEALKHEYFSETLTLCSDSANKTNSTLSKQAHTPSQGVSMDCFENIENLRQPTTSNEKFSIDDSTVHKNNNQSERNKEGPKKSFHPSTSKKSPFHSFMHSQQSNKKHQSIEQTCSEEQILEHSQQQSTHHSHLRSLLGHKDSHHLGHDHESESKKCSIYDTRATPAGNNKVQPEKNGDQYQNKKISSSQHTHYQRVFSEHNFGENHNNHYDPRSSVNDYHHPRVPFVNSVSPVLGGKISMNRSSSHSRDTSSFQGYQEDSNRHLMKPSISLVTDENDDIDYFQYCCSPHTGAESSINCDNRFVASDSQRKRRIKSSRDNAERRFSSLGTNILRGKFGVAATNTGIVDPRSSFPSSSTYYRIGEQCLDIKPNGSSFDKNHRSFSNIQIKSVGSPSKKICSIEKNIFGNIWFRHNKTPREKALPGRR